MALRWKRTGSPPHEEHHADGHEADYRVRAGLVRGGRYAWIGEYRWPEGPGIAREWTEIGNYEDAHSAMAECERREER